MASAGWEIKKGGTVVGPYSASTLRMMARNGLLQTSDLIRKKGTEKWTRAVKVKRLFDSDSPPKGVRQHNAKLLRRENGSAGRRKHPLHGDAHPRTKDSSAPVPNDFSFGYEVESSPQSREASRAFKAYLRASLTEREELRWESAVSSKLLEMSAPRDSKAGETDRVFNIIGGIIVVLVVCPIAVLLLFFVVAAVLMLSVLCPPFGLFVILNLVKR